MDCKFHYEKVHVYIAMYDFDFVAVCGYNVDEINDVKELSEIVYSAMSVVLQFLQTIIHETITVGEVTKYKDHMDKVETICIACNSGKNTNLFPLNDFISSSMNNCCRKYISVMECVQKLEVIVKYCSQISNGKYLVKTHDSVSCGPRSTPVSY